LNAYILVYAVLLITAGRLGDLYGQRNLFAIGLVIFTCASALCGISQNVGELIAARILQGVGGAVLTPQTLAIITSLFPPERRGAAFGIWGSVAGLAALAGPTLGGALVTYIDWRWIFYVNVPIGIAAVIATFAIIPDLRPGRRHGWDVIGVILATAGLFGVVFGLIEGQRYNWGEISSYVINIPEVIGAGACLLVVFIVRERYQREPLVPLSLFADRNFAVANWVARCDELWNGRSFLPHHHLPAVCAWFLGTDGGTHLGPDVRDLDVPGSVCRAVGRSDRREVHPHDWALALHDRNRLPDLHCRSGFDLDQLPDARDRDGPGDGHDLRTHDHRRHAQHLPPHVGSRLGRDEHDPPARCCCRQRGGWRCAPKPVGDHPPRSSGEPIDIPADGVQSTIRGGLQLGSWQRV